MRWGVYLLLLLLAWVLQSTLLPLLGVRWLDLLLVLALVYGLAAPVADARLAAWFTGLAQDLASSGPLGLHAFVLGLAVLGLTYVREWVNHNLWWARWLVAFSVAWPAQLVLCLHQRFLQDAPESALTWGRIISDALLVSVVAALLAAAILGLPMLVGRRRHRRRPAPRW